MTPLHWAARGNENPAVIAALVDAGADLKARTEGGLTPLHWAARGNENPAVIAALLDAGADLKARTEGGLTPLHWAARGNENPVVIAAHRGTQGRISGRIAALDFTGPGGSAEQRVA